MKHILSALLTLAVLPITAQQVATKIKPAKATPPAAAQALVRKKALPQTVAHRATSKEIGALTASLVQVNDKRVSLRWNNPEPIDGIFDDFEGHEDFVINSPGDLGWQYIDVDNANTYTWTAADFSGQGSPMAFIVFNPSQTSPSTETWPDIQPYSGKKMLIDFTVDGGNNDYIISPELSFDEDFRLSFQARSYTESYGKERFRVGYSTTGTRPSDFTFIQTGDYEEAPAAWTLYTYTIPQEAKYVCINCVSQEAFMFMLDDIFVGTNLVRPASNATLAVGTSVRLKGFNLLRNGEQVNGELITGTNYTDTVPAYDTYNYTVQAILSDGTESVSSEPLAVEVPDIRLLPFEDNFDTNTRIDTTLWSCPVDPSGNENKWKRDYYAYGLVDYGACYPYSNLSGNYEQSLVSRELRTLNPAGTHLRFQVRLDNNPKYTDNFLSAEVSADDGATWISLVDIENSEGTFGWRTYEYSLAEALGNAELFKIRFRAHGSNAWQINYWYVDDVKVWCPDTQKSEITITSAGSPLAGAALTLTADHGAVYTDTTDASGKIVIDHLELGSYSVQVEATGYNLLSTTWDVTADNASQKAFTLQRPIISWSEDKVSVTAQQESTTEKTLTLSNTGDGELFWNLTPQPAAQSGRTEYQFTPGLAFDASGDLQSGVAFDGENFYTTSYTLLGKFYKYDREGNFIEEFSVPGIYYKLYDFAYDGTYFYASDYSNYIFQIDLRNKRLVRQWQVKNQSSLTITHMAYDPRSDQFWVGDWTKLGRVDRDGNVTVSFASIGTGSEFSDDVAVMGSAFDNVTPGGPYLWLANLSHSGTNQVDNVTLFQYDLSKRILTKVTHSAIDIPGYKVGTEEMNYNNFGGLSMTTRLVSGQLTLVGTLLQSPSRIFTYRMADFDSWYNVEPTSGTLAAGAQQEVKVTLNATGLEVGEAQTATLDFSSLPLLAETYDLQLSLNVNEAATYPRPVDLTATTGETDDKVSLTWNAVSGTTPSAYEVVRDSVVLDTVTSTSYEDENIVRGTYAYAVRALYGSDYAPSILTDTVCVTIKVGAPYFAPLALKAQLSENKNVKLTWQKPDAELRSEQTLRRDEGRNDNAFGLSDGGYFYAGIGYDADEIETYRGMQITSVDVFIKEKVTSLALYVKQDGVRKLSMTNLQNENIKYGEWNTFTLTTPVTIERGSEYKIYFLVMHDSGTYPLGVSTGTTVEGKSNLMSDDSRTWYPASYMGASNINFNIAAHLSPVSDYSEQLPTAYRVLRDGKEVAEVSDTVFAETLSEPATYVYQVKSLYAAQGVSNPSDEASVTVKSIGTPIPPATLNVEVVRNSNVSLRWSLPIADSLSVPVNITSEIGTSPVDRPELLHTFRGKLTGEMGIASDGNYIYTTRITQAGLVNRYTMDGTFEGNYSIANNLDDGFSNLTYDGANFWGAAKSSEIHQLDLANMEITDTRSVSEIARHLAYIPTLDDGRGGFEVGDWETSIYVTAAGAKLGNGPTLNGAAGSAYYDGTLYTFEQGYESGYELCARNQRTGQLLWHNPISDWTAIKPASSSLAGGLSVLQTKEGMNILLASLQESGGSLHMMFDLGSVNGLAGYNVYRNGVQVNDTLLTHRLFEEKLTDPGTYAYQVQTVYIDGSKSALSQAQNVTIKEAVQGETPTDIKAVATTGGYEVNLSVVDPTYLSAAQLVNFEDGIPTTLTASGFSESEASAFAGTHALEAPSETACELIIPVEGTYSSNFALSFFARHTDDTEGAGALQVLTSTTTDDAANFINLASCTTAEAWSRYDFTLPAATKYIKISCAAAYVPQFIDAIAIDTVKAGTIYGYAVSRNGILLNDGDLAASTSYTDHNLLPGTYAYSVQAYYEDGSVSNWSEPVSITLAYSNGYQAPGQLSVVATDEGNQLTWSAPALSGVTELRWHNGISSDAAGLPSGGSYYAGVQFDKSDLAPYASKSISQVSFYINQIPDVLYVQLYEGQDLVYEKYVPTLYQYQMNTLKLDKPIPVNADKNLRVVLYVEHNSITVPLGYDEGPARTGRGDLYSADGTTWSTLTDNDIDGNWNITVGLQAYATTSEEQAATPLRGNVFDHYARRSTVVADASSQLATVSYPAASATSTANNFFTGYNIYCNGEKLNEEQLSTTTTEILDNLTHTAHYLEYQIKAIYPDYGEVGSNIVRIANTGITDVAAESSESGAITPAYTLEGKHATEAYRGIVVQKKMKRLRK